MSVPYDDEKDFVNPLAAWLDALSAASGGILGPQDNLATNDRLEELKVELARLTGRLQSLGDDPEQAHQEADGILEEAIEALTKGTDLEKPAAVLLSFYAIVDKWYA